MRRLLFTSALLVPLFPLVPLIALSGCTEPSADGGFGEAKPVKDDGRIGRPTIVDQPPRWESALTMTPAFDPSTSTLTVTLKLQPGFHAYGPGEQVSKPVALTVDPVNGWLVDGAVGIPPGMKKDLGELGTSVMLEGEIPMKAKLKGGSGAVSGMVEVQVCTDKACDRPRKHVFSISP